MAKVFIGVGHGGKDPGAVGYLVEKDINMKMAIACRNYLTARGVEIKMSRTKDENDPIGEVVRECNAYNPDLAVDVHNNAGGGDGFEVLHYSGGGTSKTLAANIESEVLKIGQNSRGLKVKLNSSGSDYYAFIRSVSAPSVILEGVFVDNKADAAQADTDAECKAFGEAYAKGILKTLGIADKVTTAAKPASKPSSNASKSDSFLVRVTATDLRIRAGAGTKFKSKGYIKPGTYTIVATEAADGFTFGKLKSGAGWIALEYTTRV